MTQKAKTVISTADLDRIPKINSCIDKFFQENSEVRIAAKDLMPVFIKASIFEKDQKNGLPIRKLLRALDENNRLDLIPSVQTERKIKNTFWFFEQKK